MKTALKGAAILTLVFALLGVIAALGCFGLIEAASRHLNGLPTAAHPLGAVAGLCVAALAVILALVVAAVAVASAFLAVFFALVLTGLILLAVALPFLMPIIVPLVVILAVIFITRHAGRSRAV
jgi:hypothetical protein